MMHMMQALKKKVSLAEQAAALSKVRDGQGSFFFALFLTPWKLASVRVHLSWILTVCCLFCQG